MIETTVTRLRTFFQSGATLSTAFRYTQLRALKNALIAHHEAIIQALSDDLKKPRFESIVSEITIILKEIEYAERNLDSWTRRQRVRTPLIFFPASSSIVAKPRGVVIIISPWNYPFQLTLLPLIGAIAAGNCAIIKPSEYAAKSAALLKKIILETFDPAYITVVEGGAQETQNLIAQKCDYIFFTGSTQTGKKIMESAAHNLTPLTLELGGKSPAIVTDSASIACAARRIAWAKFFNAGQNCISPDYVFVHTTVKDAFIAALKKEIASMFGSDAQKSPDYGRIINVKHFDRLVGLMPGGTCIYGGQSDRHNLYIAPTVLDNPDLNSALMQDEIFGPLLPILSYTNFNEVVAFINARPTPLALYLFDTCTQTQEQCITSIQAGGICINDAMVHAANPRLPFGGLGASGFGSYHGKKSFDTFTHCMPLFQGSCRFDTKLRYPPYVDTRSWWMKLLTYFL